MASGNFVSYCRVSTARQGQSGLGLEAQREAVRTFLNGGDWRLVAEFTEVESGRKSDRPELEKALAECRVRRATLVVAKVDRLTRSLSFLMRLLDAGVDVRFCDLPQIEGPTGRFMLQQLAAVAELEAGMIGDRTKKALAAAKERGRKLGGWRGKNTLTAVTRAGAVAARQSKAREQAADLAIAIRSVMNDIGQGASWRQIGAELTRRGIVTPAGKTEWQPIQIQRVLRLACPSAPRPQ